MKIIKTIVNKEHPTANLPLEFGPREIKAGHEKGDIDIQIINDENDHIAQCLHVINVYKNPLWVMWINESWQVIHTKVIAGFDLNQPEPIPNGPMKSAWEKGKAAFTAGESITAYPGSYNTAPHTIWIKGFLWAYLNKKN